MSYVINGPVDLGDQYNLNTINGDTNLVNAGATPAQGDVYYRNATGYITGLPPGTAGQVLTSGGAGADPSWGTNTAVASGYSVAKTAGLTFTTTEIPITGWNTTSPAGVTLNPFYNSGTQLNTTTGIFTPATTGVYDIQASIVYTNTNNGGTRTLTFAEQTVGPVYNPIVSQSLIQPSGSTAANQILNINQSVRLQSGLTYVLTIISSSAVGTRTILATSRFSATLIGT